MARESGAAGDPGKGIILNPQICSNRSHRFRDKLPVGEHKNLENFEDCFHLYCQYQIQAIRAFLLSGFFVAVSGGITVYYAKTIDLSNGFTIGHILWVYSPGSLLLLAS